MHQSAILGTASRATLASVVSMSSDDESSTLAPETNWTVSSCRRRAVTSWKTMTAASTEPSAATIGRARTSDQRSSPVARTR